VNVWTARHGGEDALLFDLLRLFRFGGCMRSGMTVRPRCEKITCSLKSDPLPLKVPALKLNTTHWLTTDGKFLLLDDVRYQCYTP
jgi:hypothetical protein